MVRVRLRVRVRHVLVVVKVRISLQEMHVSQCNVHTGVKLGRGCPGHIGRCSDVITLANLSYTKNYMLTLFSFLKVE